MKRRDFVFGTAAIVGSFPIVRTALGQVPCPPSALSVEGGTAGTSGSCGDSTPPSASRLTTSYSTPEQLSLTYDSTGFDSTYAATVRYSIADANDWTDAHPLYRRNPGGAQDAFCGCIFDLDENTSYDVEVTFTNGGSPTTSLDTLTTRSLPANRSAQSATHTETTLANFETRINAASPGDIIELADGNYTLTSPIVITASGTAANPIYVRGASQAGTVIDSAEVRMFSVWADHVVIEQLTMDGNYAAEFADGGGLWPAIFIGKSSAPERVTDGFTLRNCTIQNFPTACQTEGGTSGTHSNNCFVYNNTLTGTLSWTQNNLITSRGWSSDGLRLAGYGNCVWNNTMEGYGDAVCFAHSVDETTNALKYCFAYRNFIRNSANEAFELDHGTGFYGVYDNYIENCDTFVSQSDNATTSFGPSYVFRNSVVNIHNRWFKPTADWEGWHWYNNTFVRSDADPADGSGDSFTGFMDSSPSGQQTRFAYRNNLHVFRGTAAPQKLWDTTWNYGGSGMEVFDMSHNAFYPDGYIFYLRNYGDYYQSISDAIVGGDSHTILYPSGAGLSPTTNLYTGTVVTSSNPFANTVTTGSTVATEVVGAVTLELAAGTAKNTGVAIPGITNDFTGAAPDMGAVIEGRQPQVWGAQ